MTNKAKRYRTRKAKPGQLIAYFGKAERWDTPDICAATSPENGSRADSRLLLMALCDTPAVLAKHSQEKEMWPFRSLLDELDARGYDVTTLKFSIEKKDKVSAYDLLLDSPVTVWHCRNGCNGRVEWNEAVTVARCLECGRYSTNKGLR